MKFILVGLMTMSSAFAADLCTRWENNPRYVAALEAVATHLNYDSTVMCNNPLFLDIEVQPNRVFTREGERVPAVKVQFHKTYESCYYLVRDEDKAIIQSRCYSGF